jgi:hypothetical protein
MSLNSHDARIRHRRAVTAIPPSYWYVLHSDEPHTFFRDDDRISEHDWRREAPHSEVARLDRDLADARALLMSS